VFINIEEDRKKLEEMLTYSGGKYQVPVIVDGSKVTIGFVEETSLRGGIMLHGGT
jgi:glutaredoxin